MNSWFVSVEKGGPLGPVSTDFVVRALLAGNVSPHARVALGSPTAEWRPIMSVPEMIEAVSVAGSKAADELSRASDPSAPSTVYLGPHLKSTVQLPPNLALAEAKKRQATEISPKPIHTISGSPDVTAHFHAQPAPTSRPSSVPPPPPRSHAAPSLPAPPPVVTAAAPAKIDAAPPKTPGLDPKLRIVLPVGIFGVFAAIAVLETFVVLATRGIP